MKRCWVILVGMVVFAFTCRAGEKLHEFNLPDGRSLKAEVMSYNGKLDKVTLRLENKKIKKVKPGIFVKADRQYIKEWASLEGFRNKAFFKISCGRNLVEKWKNEITSTVFLEGDRSETEKESIGEIKFERYSYNITLDNRNSVALDNLEVEYCIFCKQKGKGEWDEDAKFNSWFKKETTGSIPAKSVPAKSKKTEATKPVVIARQEITGDIYSGRTGGGFEKIGAEVEGIWVRVHIKTAGGQTATRSVFMPDTLEGKYAWPK